MFNWINPFQEKWFIKLIVNFLKIKKCINLKTVEILRDYVEDEKYHLQKITLVILLFKKKKIMSGNLNLLLLTTNLNLNKHL